MSLIAYLLLLVLSGLLVGALGRLALPGRDPIGLGATILVGIAGSLLAGLLALAVFDNRGGGGLLLSVLFATLIVYGIRRARGGTLTRPAPRHRDRLGTR
jgi:uncharacterized membrane protein YeaQ/YmgE (transglycosylase-associated protein family)